MGNRRKGRECGLQILYQAETTGVPSEQKNALADISKANLQATIEEFFTHFDAPDDVHQYAASLVLGTHLNLEKIDAAISQYSNKWRIDRMTRVDRNVLRIATYELMYSHELPTRVILDEAIEVAKRFGSEQSAAFVNGILDTIAKKVRRNS